MNKTSGYAFKEEDNGSSSLVLTEYAKEKLFLFSDCD
jgi:hypothetical protein